MLPSELLANVCIVTMVVVLAGTAAAQEGAGGQSRESMAVDATASQWSFQFALEGNFDYKTDEIAPGVTRPEGGRGFLQYRMVAPIPRSENFPVTLLPRLTLRAVESGQRDWGLGQSDVFILTIINQWAKGRWGSAHRSTSRRPRADFPELVAIVLLVGASFVVGLVVRSAIGRRLGSGIESATVGRLPLYGVLKSFTQTLMGSDRAEAFQPAILAGADGSIELAFLIEDHGDGRATILLPWSPTAMAGSLRVVSRDQVRLLNTDLGEFTRVLGQWGVGTKEMLGKGER